jgi:APA family basic amino acid/polyamine antiporter
MWGYPVTPILFAGVSFWFVGNTMMTTPGPSFVGLGIIATGIPVYFYWSRGRLTKAI